MLKLLGLINNYSYKKDYYKKLNSTRNKCSSSNKKKSNIPSSKRELTKACNESTGKKKDKKKTSKNSEKKSVNSYQYIQQKASNYINSNANKFNDPKKNVNIIVEDKNKINKINFSSSICHNKNKKNKRARNRIDDQNDKIKNLTADKKIREIKIKSNFNMSYMSYINLFVNKNNGNNEIQNLTTYSNNNNERMSTVSNINKNKGNIFTENNNVSQEKNKTLLNSMCSGVYHKKKLKIFNSLSRDKRPKIRNTIESIEICFSPKIYINKFQLNNSQHDINQYQIGKIIKIQKYFRKFLVEKYRRNLNEKIMEGILYLNLFIRKKLFFSFKYFFLIYRNKCEAKNKKNIGNTFYVEKSQFDMLNILKEKNIYSMIDLKKYIVDLIKNNKFEMF